MFLVFICCLRRGEENGRSLVSLRQVITGERGELFGLNELPRDLVDLDDLFPTDPTDEDTLRGKGKGIDRDAA